MSTNKALKIFVSSTFLDLKEYREAARASILGLKNHANDMIYWPADERDPEKLSLAELGSSELPRNLDPILSLKFKSLPIL